MTARIKRLPSFVANQIAAGEVIERPASVVKELLENAFDADASEVSVEIGFGGLNLIKVSDNGTGILAEDLPLAIAPHATSKIQQLSDLYEIQSMGFRGEALASISSVSRLVIHSKSVAEEHGMKLETVNEKIICSACARSQGTTIEVHDIFFNAPVRKKFLKSERGEFQAIEMTVKRAAMSAPTVAMSLIHNGKLQWQLNPATCEQSMRVRISKLFGKKFIDTAGFIDVEHGGMRLRGWLGDVNYQRSQNDGMWIYLNNRMIKDKLLYHAIKQAYVSVLHPGRYPVCLLYFTVNPADVDVNVHPTKHEVRFQQARLVHDFIVSQLSRFVEMSALPANYELSEISSSAPDEEIVACRVEVPLALNFARVAPRPNILAAPDLSQIENNPRYVDTPWDNTYAIDQSAGIVGGSSHVVPRPRSSRRTVSQTIAIDQQFSLVCAEDEVYLADLAGLRAHWFLNLLQQKETPWESRPLLVPIYHYDCSRDFNEDQSLISILLQLGIQAVIVERDKLMIRSLPEVIPQLDIKSFLNSAFSLPAPSLSQFIAVLVDNFSQNPSVMSQWQRSAFVDYLDVVIDCEAGLVSQNVELEGADAEWGSAAHRSESMQKFIKKISPELCQELFHA